MYHYRLNANCRLVLKEGNLTLETSDAIVNAANRRLLGGGGVDGAIHLAAGPGLLEACRLIPEVEPEVRCPTGEARLTDACELPCRFVIHAVGPIYQSAASSAPLLRSAYRSSLQLANDHRLSTVAFPAISCGVFGYPMEEAAEVALGACRDFAGQLQEIRFLLFAPRALERWQQVAQGLLQPEDAA